MLDDAGTLTGTLALGVIIGIVLGAYLAIDRRMTEAYNLGLAQECLGKEGYYFTCD